MRILIAGAVSFAVILSTASPASADGIDGGSSIGFGNSDSYDIVGPDAVSSLIDSSYSLSDLDPVTGAVTSGDLNSTLTSDYATSSELADSSFLAMDTAQLALQAQQQADAQRRAQAGQHGGLKPGSVPPPYDSMITAAIASQCPTLDASVLAAQLKQESGFNPRAVSPSGAEGFAQFLPGTWATYGVDGNGDGKKDIWDPADAIPSAAHYDCVLKSAVRNVPGDPTSNMLAAYNAGPEAVLQYNGIPPFAETQNYVSTILASAQNFAAPSTGQTTVGPDGCPTSAPSNTLRDGSASIGIAKLCADSVAQARTPQAANAIIYALTHLGLPYSQGRRMDPGWYDCSSYVMRSYQATGLKMYTSWAEVTTSIVTAPWAVQIPLSQAKPGDLIEPEPGHVVMHLADGFHVHTNQDGDVSHVAAEYGSAYWTGYVDPAKAQ